MWFERIFLSTPSGWRATAWPARHWSAIWNFYPRPPGGGRQYKALLRQRGLEFLSTPSGWRATREGLRGRPCGRRDFYPRPPGGGRPKMIASSRWSFGFLSTPSGWRATQKFFQKASTFLFLSTPSGWRATCYTLIRDNFKNKFLSTPSGWRATLAAAEAATAKVISIHALRVEGDYRDGE